MNNLSPESNYKSSEEFDTKPSDISHEELRAGHLLQDNETLVIDTSDRAIASATLRRGPLYVLPDNKDLITENSVAVTEFYVGGLEPGNFARGVFYVGDKGKFVKMYGSDGAVNNVIQVSHEQPLQIGRSTDDFTDLGEFVSRDHCAVGVTEEGNFFIQNHNPSNYTEVKSFI